jgi:hypothetical protein
MSSTPRKAARDQDRDEWPVDRHSEEVVLGNAVQDWVEVKERIGPDLFWDDSNRRIFRAMQDLDEHGEPVDSLTISKLLDRDGLHDGDIGVLVQLGTVPVLKGPLLDTYIRTLDKNRRLRALAIGGNKIMTAAMINGADPEVIRQGLGKLHADSAGPTEANIESTSAAELYDAEIAPLRPLFANLLWDGLTMLVAKPKAGKSWFTLQCAVAVAGGRVVTGATALDCGTVLYAALEEPKARTQSRLRKIAPKGDWAGNLHFVYSLLPLMQGGAEQLAELIRQKRPRLVIIDTFTAAVKIGAKAGSDIFRAQYAECSTLRKLAEEFHVAMIVVHHDRKALSASAIEAISGTGGIPAAIDGIWWLKRRPEGEATLEVIGRDTEEHTLALHFDRQPFGWRITGDGEVQSFNAERQEIIKLLKDEGGLTSPEIAAELDKKRGAVRMMLMRMKNDGIVTRDGKKYFLTHTHTGVTE